LSYSSCERIQQLLFDYVDGELSEDDKQLVEKHTAECEKCRRELEIRRELISLIRDSAYTPKHDLAAAFLGSQALLEKPKKRRININRLVRYAGAAAAAVLVVTVIAVYGVYGGLFDRMIGGSGSDAAAENEAVGIAYDELTQETLAAAATVQETMAVNDEDGAAELYSDVDEYAGTVMYSTTLTTSDDLGSKQAASGGTNAAAAPTETKEIPPTAEEGSAETPEYEEADDDAPIDTKNKLMTAKPLKVTARSILAECGADEYIETTNKLYMFTEMSKPLPSEITDNAKEYECSLGVVYILTDSAAWDESCEAILAESQYMLYTSETVNAEDPTVALLVYGTVK